MNEPENHTDQIREKKAALQAEADRLQAETSKALKFSVIMISIDRSTKGKENYLAQTLENFYRSGCFFSPHFEGLDIFAGSDEDSHICRLDPALPFCYSPADRLLLPCENAGHALISGGLTAIRSSSDYVLFLEDDLDFCADFLESCAAWLSSCSEDRYRLFAFGCAYPQVKQIADQQLTIPTMSPKVRAWNYPVDAFYGTQCFAIRPQDALSLGIYLQSNPDVRGVKSPGAYDLMVHDWMKLNYPDSVYSHFLASVPSFVQHIGRQSICTGVDKTHEFPSWPGREWTFAAKG